MLHLLTHLQPGENIPIPRAAPESRTTILRVLVTLRTETERQGKPECPPAVPRSLLLPSPVVRGHKARRVLGTTDTVTSKQRNLYPKTRHPGPATQSDKYEP